MAETVNPILEELRNLAGLDDTVKRRITIHYSGQELIDYYFPAKDLVSLRVGEVDRAHQFVTTAGSCVRCGALVLSASWDSHIQWHTNAVR